MSAKNRRLTWVRDVERRSGLSPLTHIMARFVDAYNVRSVEELRVAIDTKELNGVGVGTINMLRQLAGIPIPVKVPVVKPATYEQLVQRIKELEVEVESLKAQIK